MKHTFSGGNARRSRRGGRWLPLLMTVPVLGSLAGGVTAGRAAAEPAPEPPAATAPTGADLGLRPLPEVLAIVNGTRITAAEIAVPAREETLLRTLRDARAAELDLQVNSMLLEAEARRRGVSTTRLLRNEVSAAAKEPTNAEVRALYDEKRGEIPDAYESVKEAIRDRLRDEREAEAAKGFAARLRAAAEVRVLAAQASPPRGEADLAHVMATVNGQPITCAQVEEALRPLVYQTERSLYDLRSGQLELRINDLLLEQEAKRRGKSTREVLAAEVRPKPLTEADARAFYDENRARINGEYEPLKAQIRSYLEDRERQRAEAEFAARLRAAGSVQLFLTRPEPPVYSIAVDDQPSLGSPAAPLTAVVFVDLATPKSAQTLTTLMALVKEKAPRLRLVVRDYPLEQHADAFKAAEAAEAARAQGLYWEFLGVVLRNQDALQVPLLRIYAIQAGLDHGQFADALNRGRFAESVERDRLDAGKLGLTVIPSVYLNGRPVEDVREPALRAAIEAALAALPR